MGSVSLEAWVIGVVAVVMALIRIQIGIERRRSAATDVRFQHWAPYTVAGLTASGGVAGWLATGLGRPILLSWLVGINVVAFVFYGWDKVATFLAIARVPERTLHLLALGGGSVGALLAQGMFRHKTEKRAFQLRFWGVVALQAVLISAYVNTQNA